MLQLEVGCCAGGLGAVFRTVLETMRTLFVWLVDLLLFYTPLGMGKLGEAWTTYSFIQAAGCAKTMKNHDMHTFEHWTLSWDMGPF